MVMDRRHKWQPVHKGKFTTRYVCRVCGKRASKVHDLTGAFHSLLKRHYTPAIIRQLHEEEVQLPILSKLFGHAV